MADEETPETPEEKHDTGPWYNKYGYTDQDKINVLSQYKSDEAFIEGAIETKKKIGAMFSAPEPSDPEYADKLKNSRIRLGAKATPDEYQADIPEELQEYSTDEFLKNARDQAAKWGLTQAEYNEAIKERLELAKEQAGDNQKSIDDAAKEKVARREKLEGLWGRRTDDILAKCMDLANHFDTTLFAKDNMDISTEERAEKGGLLAQKLKNADDPDLWRLFAVLNDKFLSEGSSPDHIASTKSSMYQERYKQAQASYPARGHEWWDELANARTPI